MSSAKPSKSRNGTQLFVVDLREDGPEGQFFRSLKRRLHPGVRRLSTPEDVVDTFRSTVRPSVWFAPNDGFVSHLASAIHEPKGDHRLVVFDELPPQARDVVSVYFRHVLTTAQGGSVLDTDELTDVLAGPDREDLIIGGLVRRASGVLVLFRGTLEPLVVPLSWFAGGSESPPPDYEDLAIEDFGHTVRLGDFEAATDAILYEFDRGFRKRAREKQRALDRSFGGSLRRLRLQKGVSREDFPQVAAKTIARLERNEVRSPRPRTLRTIAKRLGVPVEELGSF